MQQPEIAPPSGNVTFVFTDLVGSSQISKKLPYRDYEGKLLDPQFVLFSDLIVRHHGYECGTPAGDSVMAAFQSVHDALDCAVAMQQELPRITYTDPINTTWTLTARIGVHRAGQEVQPTDRGLYSSHPEANYAARIMAIAHAGQIVVSDSARIAAGNRQEVFKPYPNRRIKDSEEKPQVVHEMLYDGKEREEPGSQFVPGWFREKNHYVARPELENRITALFTRRTGNNTPYRLITLHGFGGMGKTRLAMQCCLNAAGLFEGRLFLARLDGISDEAMTSDESRKDYLVSSLIQCFKLPEAPATYQNLPKLLPNAGPMLLLLDNYETVKGKASAALIDQLLEARPNLSILVTGRETVGLNTVEVTLDMEGLQPGEGRELLITRVREKGARFDWAPSNPEELAITQILMETARIPLAIELVAAHSDEMTLPEIASGLASEPLGEMTETPQGTYSSDPSWRHETLEKCYNWSWRLLDAEAQHALACCSLFADRCLSEEVTACFPDVKRAPLARLQQASLIYREEEARRSVFSLLRPTRAYARQRLHQLDTDSALQRHFVAFYLQIVEENGGESNLEDSEKRSHLEANWRNAIAAAYIAEELQDNQVLFAIENQLGNFLYRQAKWAEAEQLCDKVLKLRENVLGADHPDIATSLNNLAGLYEAQGRYEEAEPMYKQALEIRQRVLPADHPAIATSLNNLAGLYRAQGRYEEAEPMYKQALTMCETALGPEHPTTKIVRENTVRLRHTQQNSREGTAAEKVRLFIKRLFS